MPIAALLAASAVAFTPMPTAGPVLRAPRARVPTSPQLALGGLDAAAAAMTSAPGMATLLLAEEGGGINPVFLLLGSLPLVAGGAFLLVSGEEQKIRDRRADPANADRLGYTVEEVNAMPELKRLRYESDLKLYMADKKKAAELGVPVEQVTAERLAVAPGSKDGKYFSGDDYETAGATRF